jgi:proteic killer suppression protein
MEVRFGDTNLERLETDPGYLGGWPVSIVRAFRKRLNFIRQAVSERDLYVWKSLRIEKLKGDRQGQESMRLNDQWRLIFVVEGEDQEKCLIVLGIEDYH